MKISTQVLFKPWAVSNRGRHMQAHAQEYASLTLNSEPSSPPHTYDIKDISGLLQQPPDLTNVTEKIGLYIIHFLCV